MKEIKIEEIHLLNFKGIRNLRVNFSDMTEISGDNGLGKTTIADAIWWLLFGKDSQGREKFEIKTLDEAGKPIERLPHEVNGIFAIDGKRITLSRKFNEKWVKKGGKEEFRGHEIERFFNDVPCTDKEYTAKIAEICNEQDFKYLTNPFYFCTRSSEDQKEKLLEMAGEISDAEVAAGNKDFEYLLSLLSESKSLDELKKEIRAKKGKINDKIAGIPDRIDEQKRTMPEALDWKRLEEELQEKESALEDIQDQIMDIAKRNEAQDNATKQIYEEINQIRKKISERESEISNEANVGFFEKQKQWTDLHQKAVTIKTDIKANETFSSDLSNEIEKLTSQREKLIEEYKMLVARKREIEIKSIVFSEEQFICPTCRQQLPEEGIEARRMELIANFNSEKEKELAHVAKLIAENMKKGESCSKTLLNEKQESLNSFTKQRELLEKEYNAILDLPAYKNEPMRVDVQPIIEKDSLIADYNHQIVDLQRKADSSISKVDFSELSAKQASLKSAINVVKHNLSKREQYQSVNSRIKELEGQYSILAGKLEEQDKLEKIISDFNKAKNEEIARRIDNLFAMVKFRWIAFQVNGGEKETCEVTVNGVPYASLNHAGKINAGLDIINAISKHLRVSAPVIIDNAESVNNYLPTDSQLILFRVSSDKELEITHKQ